MGKDKEVENHIPEDYKDKGGKVRWTLLIKEYVEYGV